MPPRPPGRASRRPSCVLDETMDESHAHTTTVTQTIAAGTWISDFHVFFFSASYCKCQDIWRASRNSSIEGKIWSSSIDWSPGSQYLLAGCRCPWPVHAMARSLGRPVGLVTVTGIGRGVGDRPDGRPTCVAVELVAVSQSSSFAGVWYTWWGCLCALDPGGWCGGAAGRSATW